MTTDGQNLSFQRHGFLDTDFQDFWEAELRIADCGLRIADCEHDCHLYTCNLQPLPFALSIPHVHACAQIHERWTIRVSVQLCDKIPHVVSEDSMMAAFVELRCLVIGGLADLASAPITRH